MTLLLFTRSKQSCCVDAVHLRCQLRNVETDRCDRLHDWCLRIVGALTALLGPHVPLEEPSTASEAEMRCRLEIDNRA
jgi:hypothetical protein